MSPLKRLLLLTFTACLLTLSHAWAGPVSLESSEIQQLRALLRADSNAAAQFIPIRALADRALLEQPAPVAQVISEGHLATDPRKIQTVASFQDLAKTEALAWTWAVTGDPRYLARVRVFLTAWAKINRPDGDPINEAVWEPMLVAYDLTRANTTQPDRDLVDAWFRGKAGKLMARQWANNNWGGHAVKAVGLIGLTLNDEKAASWATHEFKNLIQTEIHPDGSTMDFYQRDALHYQLGSIVPLLYFARAEARHGENLFDYASPSGASLHAAVDFVVPFADGTKTHIEFAHSKVKFDMQRANDGEATYMHHQWDPKASLELFVRAAWFRPEYGALAATIAGQPGAPYISWDMVINAVSRHTDAAVLTATPAPLGPAAEAARFAAFQQHADSICVTPPGMEFVPVPITGGPTDTAKGHGFVLFSKTLATVAQFREFVQAGNKNRPWPKPDFAQGDDHPAVNVSWNDANGFCVWLTAREHQASRLPAAAKYRLPTDHEWSCAVGIGAQEDAGASPKSKAGEIHVYPWGAAWPPPKGAGNYAESISYDGYDHTSPVKAFSPNVFGLYDMGGNVWQWCADKLDPGDSSAAALRVLRGASWGSGAEKFLRSSSRASGRPADQDELNGFRCVLELPSGG
jgi:formylglycine-generating enzyme required for sulfatase activity